MSKVPNRVAEKEMTDDLRPSLDIYEVAKLIGCCTKTVVKLCDDGELAFHRVGNRRKFRREDLENFWSKNRSELKSQKAPRSVDITSAPSVRSSKHSEGGDRKVSDKGPLNTGVSKAHRLRDLAQEMRKW